MSLSELKDRKASHVDASSADELITEDSSSRRSVIDKATTMYVIYHGMGVDIGPVAVALSLNVT